MGEEIRLTFTSANSGTYGLPRISEQKGISMIPGTFHMVTPSLEEKTDWQRTETSIARYQMTIGRSGVAAWIRLPTTTGS